MRWGRTSWGNEQWGAEGPRTALAWAVEIDWDADGSFDGQNECDRLLSVATFRGRKTYLNTDSGFAPVETGGVSLVLDNSDGRYDPWNKSSPLYPNVSDGREVRIRVKNELSGTIYPIMRGVITDINSGGFGADAQVTLRIEDGWRSLRRTAARVAVALNTTPDAAIGLVLDAAKWPARWGRDLDLASDNIGYFWSSGARQAGDELERLAGSFLGYFTIAADGQARYITRNSADAPAATLTQEMLSTDLAVQQPWEYRRNITRIRTHPLNAETGVTLWQSTGDAAAIASGTPLILWANYTYNGQTVSGKNVITPLAYTDWTANTSSSGGGTDKTGDVTLTFSDLGDTAKLTFSYAGGGTIYLISPKIRGDALIAQATTDVTYPADIDSVDEPREFLLDLPWQQNINAARDYVDIMGPFFESAHPFPVIRLEARPETQFGIDVFDLVALSLERLGIDGVSYRVAGVGHQSDGNTCQRVISTFYLEPYIGGGTYWTWPVTNFGVDSIFGW